MNTYINPSNALKIGHSILQCCDIFESQSIIEGKSDEKLQKLRNFTIVFQKEWKYAISSNAIQDMNKKKINKSVKLPNADDIKLLNEMIKGKNLIEKGVSGEVERIKVNDYLNRNQNKMQNEIMKPLTDVEGAYCGTDCLRKSADACGASDPEQLTSTKLRKHIATMSQLLNLTNSDREQLANFMGHDLAINNEYYRLPDEALQIS
ncbi:Uncharacterized protein FWK35_00031610, partial [Aphis craccivora]